MKYQVIASEKLHDGYRPCTSLSYQQHKGILNFNNRDFLEKYIAFSDLQANTFYVYFTALPDNEVNNSDFAQDVE